MPTKTYNSIVKQSANKPIVCLLGVGFVASCLIKESGDQFAFIKITRENFQDASAAILESDYVISSIPPDKNLDKKQGLDAVLNHHINTLYQTTAKVIYLSSTGVYKEENGHWVDEYAACDPENRRYQVEKAWCKAVRNITVLRLGGIYGQTNDHGRGLIAQMKNGQVSQRINAPQAIMNRIHVLDIFRTIKHIILNDINPGIYNLVDDHPATSRTLIDYVARHYNLKPPPLVPLKKAELSPMAQEFYRKNKRVDNRRIKRATGLLWRYPSFKEAV